MWELRGYRAHSAEDDIRLDGAWRAGASCCPLGFDVQVTDPRGVGVRAAALASWGGAAGVAIDGKERRHRARLREAGWGFGAMVWEVHGFASPAVTIALEAFAAERFPQDVPGSAALRSMAVRSGRRRLAVVLQSGNAMCFLARGPVHGSGGAGGAGGDLSDASSATPGRPAPGGGGGLGDDGWDGGAASAAPAPTAAGGPRGGEHVGPGDSAATGGRGEAPPGPALVPILPALGPGGLPALRSLVRSARPRPEPIPRPSPRRRSSARRVAGGPAFAADGRVGELGGGSLGKPGWEAVEDAAGEAW